MYEQSETVFHLRIFVLFDNSVGVELRAILHISHKRRRSRFLSNIRISNCTFPIVKRSTHDSNPTPSSCTLTNSGKVVSEGPVLLLSVVCRSEIVDRGNGSLDLGEVWK
jgi:hypothetical protein